MTRLLWILLWVVLAASVVADFVGPSKEVHHLWEFKAFFALFGFLGCAVIVYVSGWLGKHWLQRPTDYYEPVERFEAEESPGNEGGGNG